MELLISQLNTLMLITVIAQVIVCISSSRCIEVNAKIISDGRLLPSPKKYERRAYWLSYRVKKRTYVCEVLRTKDELLEKNDNVKVFIHKKKPHKVQAVYPFASTVISTIAICIACLITLAVNINYIFYV